MPDLTGLRGPGNAGSREQARVRAIVSFDNNRLLPRLLGEHDVHLALIEDRLGIEAHAHGNQIILSGAASECEIAREVLEELYQRVARGQEVAPGDFDGLIRHGRQPESNAGGPAEVVTRRRIVKARTPMQSAYMKALAEDDLVFGIGPAGTGKTYIAVAYAAHCLERGLVERIILSRPAVEAGERLGFLPGDLR